MGIIAAIYRIFNPRRRPLTIAEMLDYNLAAGYLKYDWSVCNG